MISRTSAFASIVALIFWGTAAFAQVPRPPCGLAVDGAPVDTSNCSTTGGGGGGGGSTPSGAPTPTATSHVVFDTRAGGRQNFQNMTSLSQMQNVYGGVRNSGGATSFFETNVDGRGTNARGCQWSAPTGTEQECFVATEAISVEAPSSGWYTQFKTYLGKSPTGGGTGPTDSWTLTGGNPHQKIFIWTRENAGERFYLRIMPSGTNIVIDGLNYNSPMFSKNLYGMRGPIEVTVYMEPNTGTLRAWVNGERVLEATRQNIGRSGLTGIQETITTFPGQRQVQYMWDTVVWY